MITKCDFFFAFVFVRSIIIIFIVTCVYKSTSILLSLSLTLFVSSNILHSRLPSMDKSEFIFWSTEGETWA